MRPLRYVALCELCGWSSAPVLRKRRAERLADEHSDEHELAFLKGSF